MNFDNRDKEGRKEFTTWVNNVYMFKWHKRDSIKILYRWVESCEEGSFHVGLRGWRLIPDLTWTIKSCLIRSSLPYTVGSTQYFLQLRDLEDRTSGSPYWVRSPFVNGTVFLWVRRESLRIHGSLTPQDGFWYSDSVESSSGILGCSPECTDIWVDCRTDV